MLLCCCSVLVVNKMKLSILIAQYLENKDLGICSLMPEVQYDRTALNIHLFWSTYFSKRIFSSSQWAYKNAEGRPACGVHPI